MRENVVEGMRTVLSQFALRASLTLGDDTLERVCSDAMNSAGPGGALSLTLSRWAAADRKPLVLLIDEIDALVGDTLLSVLRQLRSGYDQRPAAFPHSIILCGVRGADEQAWSTEDVAYVCDLGLVAQDAAASAATRPRVQQPTASAAFSTRPLRPALLAFPETGHICARHIREKQNEKSFHNSIDYTGVRAGGARRVCRRREPQRQLGRDDRAGNGARPVNRQDGEQAGLWGNPNHPAEQHIR